MQHILAIDTAGPVIGVALRVGGGVLVRHERTKRGSEQRVVPWVEQLLAEAQIARSQLDGIGVARGPGAFTGLRVGLATAVGLSLALDRPIWGCDSLTPRALRVPGDRVLAMLDARKQRVYAALYMGGVGAPPIDAAPGDALNGIDAGFVATGEGALVYADHVAEAGGVVAPEADHPGVDVLARLADDAIAQGRGGDALSLTPFYLRAPDAQIPKSMRGRQP